jgi:MFS family permease
LVHAPLLEGIPNVIFLIRREKHPLVDLSLFANGAFLSSNLANAMISFSFFGALILLPIYLQELRGFSAFESGLFTLPLALASVVTAILGGRLVDRFGPRLVLFPGLMLMGLSTWQLAGITLSTSYAWLILVFAVRGFGLGLLVQTLTVAALSQVPQRQYTQASSLTTVVRFVSTSLGIAVLATFVQSRASTHFTTLVNQLRPTSHAAIVHLSQQGLTLALQDAFWLSLMALVLAVIAVCFLRVPRVVAQEQGERAAQHVMAE